MSGYKNPALRKEEGVLKGYCIDCGELIGTEFSMSWYALIRSKYCRSCSELHRMECDRIRHQRHRQGIRAERRERKTQAELLRAENRELRKIVMILRNETEMLKKKEDSDVRCI